MRKPIGIDVEFDDLGRLVIPKKFRYALGNKVSLQMYEDDNNNKYIEVRRTK